MVKFLSDLRQIHINKYTKLNLYFCSRKWALVAFESNYIDLQPQNLCGNPLAHKRLYLMDEYEYLLLYLFNVLELLELFFHHLAGQK